MGSPSADDDDSSADAGRLNALTDGVVAIAITLLALDLKPDLPKPAGSAELAHALRDNLDRYVGFAIAFWLIAQYWGVHHRLMRGVRRGSSALVLVTFLFLFGITAAPFTTSMNGEYSNSLSTFLFSLNIMFISGSGTLLALTIRRGRLKDIHETEHDRVRRVAHSAVTLLIPALVAVLAWFLDSNANWFFLLFIVADVPGRRLAHHRAARPS